MKENLNSSDFEKYAEDISTIKSMLLDVDKKLFFDLWAFFTWGGLFLSVSLIHFLAYSFWGMSISTILMRIWLPAFILGSFLETIAWMRWMGRESLKMTSRPAKNMLLAIIAVMWSAALIMYFLYRSGGFFYFPDVILIMFSLAMMFYGQNARSELLSFGFFILFFATVLNFLGLEMNAKFVVSGIVLGLVFIIEGILFRKIRKRNNE